MTDKKYKGKVSLRMPPTLHSELVERAKEEGVSLNQYIVYRLSIEMGKNLVTIDDK